MTSLASVFRRISGQQHEGRAWIGSDGCHQGQDTEIVVKGTERNAQISQTSLRWEQQGLLSNLRPVVEEEGGTGDD